MAPNQIKALHQLFTGLLAADVSGLFETPELKEAFPNYHVDIEPITSGFTKLIKNTPGIAARIDAEHDARKALDTAIHELCQSEMTVDVPKRTVTVSLGLFTNVVVAFDAVEKQK
jgi:hypothetical protein